MTPAEILERLREECHRTGLSLQALADRHARQPATLRSHEAGDRAFTLVSLVEHAGWLGLEVVLLPVGAGAGGELWQRGYDHAVAQVVELFGLPIDAAAMRGHNEPRADPAPVEWDDAIGEAYGEIARESADARAD